jgi:2-keto-4-pentenoate hydratase/2-oxohepta-3-ene-1,7-dioic acid hydratase in catechol pathway
MKLVRFGQTGAEKPGLHQDNAVYDLSAMLPGIPDIGESFFRDGWFDKVFEMYRQDLTLASFAQTAVPYAKVRLGPPVCRPSKIICIGKNYLEHAKEGGFDVPKKPLLFCKSQNTINGPFDPILMPASSHMIDWEVELAVIIGREGKRIRKQAAYEHVAGYTILNDVSAREAQFSDSQWFRGKSFDTFAPIGPALVTPDDIGDPHNLNLKAIVDGETMQNGNTMDLIFDIPTLIEFISQDITLVPGDIISTGTPSGVGIFRNPPVVLKPGNAVECRIDKIGALINICVAE